MIRGAAIFLLSYALVGPATAGHAQPDPEAGDTEARTGADAEDGAARAEVPADPAQRRARVVARFARGQITVGDVEDELSGQSPAIRRRFVEDPEYRQEFLQRMVRFALLAREADKRGYDQRDEVQRAVKQQAVQVLLRTEFDEKLTPETVSDEDLEAYYEAHIAEFRRPATVRASHILVKDADDAKDLSAQAKKADLRTFRQLAREHSLDEQTKLRGGDLRYFDAQGKAHGQQEADIPAPLVEAAFALKNVGDVTPRPIETDQGYSVLMLTGRRPEETRSLDDAETSIRLRVWRQQRQEAIDRFLAQLKERIEPQLFPERLGRIELDGEKPGASLTPGFPEAPPPSQQQ